MFRIVYFAIPAISALYYAILLFSKGSVSKFEQLAIICVTLIVLMSTFFMRPPLGESEPEKPAQRFIIGTTIQLLLSLAFLMYSKYTFTAHFNRIAVSFIILFIPLLLVQSIFLLRNLKK